MHVSVKRLSGERGWFTNLSAQTSRVDEGIALAYPSIALRTRFNPADYESG